MPPGVGRPSLDSNASSQSTDIISQTRVDLAEPMRSRSTASPSKMSRAPGSRGSTASIHSSATHHAHDKQHAHEGLPQYMVSQSSAASHSFNSNPEELIFRFGEQSTDSYSNATYGPALQGAHKPSLSRANIAFKGQELRNQTHPVQDIPQEMHSHSLPNDAMSQYPLMYDTTETQIPDQIMGEIEVPENNPRKRRGTTSTIANDNELRKLLRQYDGWGLKEMAEEVQRHEGTGGKSEKVKQVFAMVWLKENCRKSSGSVRRDKVYCCYADMCGTERVSVLNPASFGKLVRIIFPNVQTRRLGVRGESKYHYVDLSVIEEKQQQNSASIPSAKANGNADQLTDKHAKTTAKQRSTTQPPTDTAVFPPPNKSFIKKPTTSPFNPNCACGQSEPPLSSTMTPSSLDTQTGKMVFHMLQFPSANELPATDNDSVELPNIHNYLPPNTDAEAADGLATLYRTHCISVIDSFRYCKEKNFFRYFSTFHGTLTVPIQKLLTDPSLAAWITECDWLMYQKMIAFVSPLTTQVVPKAVLDAFSSISKRLTSHIAETFKSQPTHVSMAKLVPAHIFCHLLGHMLDVNQAANAAAAWLCHPDNRNQMWADFVSLIDPKEMISKANIPTCAEKTTEHVLKHDIRALLTPLNDTSYAQAHPFFSQPDDFDSLEPRSFMVEPTAGDEYTNFPDRWISFILNLPDAFPAHRAQCVVDKVGKLWDCILHRLTLGGAQSFSAWWMTKVFFHEMMVWQAEKGGFMNSTPSSIKNHFPGSEEGSSGAPIKGQLGHLKSFRGDVSMNSETGPGNSRPRTAATTASHYGLSREGSVDNSLRNGSIAQHTNGGNKPPLETDRKVVDNAPLNNDDSAIDLDEDSVLMAVGKYGDMMVSDPADAEGDVVVI